MAASADPAPGLTALIWGHSFITNLQCHIAEAENPIFRGDFDLREYTQVYWEGKEGRTFSSIEFAYQSVIKRYQPDVVFVMCFANDLDGPADPDVLADRARTFGANLLESGAKVVIFSMVLPRYQTHNISVEEYTNKERRFNELMSKQIMASDSTRKVPKFKSSNIMWWWHRRIQFPRLSDDGIHFNQSENRQFYFSIRRALVMAAERLLTSSQDTCLESPESQDTPMEAPELLELDYQILFDRMDGQFSDEDDTSSSGHREPSPAGPMQKKKKIAHLVLDEKPQKHGHQISVLSSYM